MPTYRDPKVKPQSLYSMMWHSHLQILPWLSVLKCLFWKLKRTFGHGHRIYDALAFIGINHWLLLYKKKKKNKLYVPRFYRATAIVWITLKWTCTLTNHRLSTLAETPDVSSSLHVGAHCKHLCCSIMTHGTLQHCTKTLKTFSWQTKKNIQVTK